MATKSTRSDELATLEILVATKGARDKHPLRYASFHEGHSFLREEFEELWDEIKCQEPKVEKIKAELLDMMAVGVRMLVDLC